MRKPVEHDVALRTTYSVGLPPSIPDCQKSFFGGDLLRLALASAQIPQATDAVAWAALPET